MHRDVDSGPFLEVVERLADLLDGLVGAVEGRAEDRNDADRVLVAPRDCFLGREMEPVSFHRDEPHLDVPVVGELLPADLHVDPHDEVRAIRRLPGLAAALLPAALQRQPAEHRSLARTGRRAPGRMVGVGGIPEAAERVDAAHLELRRLRVLVLVDHVLVEALGHEPLGLRLHPGGDEGREVHPRIAVEHQLVVDDLIGDIRRHLAVRDPMPRDVVAFQREHGRDREIVLARSQAPSGV